MIATRAPSMRKRRAVASPIPLDPPVTTTRLPARPRMQVMLTSGYPVSGAPEQPMTAYPTAASTMPADEPIVDEVLEPPLAPPGAAPPPPRPAAPSAALDRIRRCRSGRAPGTRTTRGARPFVGRVGGRGAPGGRPSPLCSRPPRSALRHGDAGAHPRHAGHGRARPLLRGRAGHAPQPSARLAPHGPGRKGGGADEGVDPGHGRGRSWERPVRSAADGRSSLPAPSGSLDLRDHGRARPGVLRVAGRTGPPANPRSEEH